MLERKDNYSEFKEKIKEELVKVGSERPSTVKADWERIGGEEGLLITKGNESSRHSFIKNGTKKGIKGVSQHVFDDDIGKLKEIWKTILCSDQPVLDFLSKYASQNGFLEASGFYLCHFFHEKFSFACNPKQSHKFISEKSRLKFKTVVLIENIRSTKGTELIEVLLDFPIEFEVSIDILTGEVSDEKRLTNPEIKYFGPKRRREDSKGQILDLEEEKIDLETGFAEEVSDYDSGEGLLSSGISNGSDEVDSGQGSSKHSSTEDLSTTGRSTPVSGFNDEEKEHETDSSGYGSGSESNSTRDLFEVPSQLNEDEVKKKIDGMIFFHNDFKLNLELIHKQNFIADATKCFKELEGHFDKQKSQSENLPGFLKKMRGLEVCILYYQEWVKEGKKGNLHDYIEENKEKFQPVVEGMMRRIIVNRSEATHSDNGNDEVDKLKSEEEQDEIICKLVTEVENKGGLKRQYQLKVDELKNLRRLKSYDLIMTGSSFVVFLASSAILTTSLLEQAGAISSNYFSVAKTFNNPVNIAATASILIVTLLSIVAAAATISRVDSRMKKIAETQQFLQPKSPVK
ncbi:MAG: hypothetical protein HRK26_00745 [Rickettsiaceae bacterium H1]|nr:hypothetical protein [Rickettsiaceae bacterium H1]